ncbi:MAG TPA: DNA polymerase domain-containing protein, partial [Aquella sp.]|nr:DNA polymerase domain-containing protein [Aquella sp.]
WVPNPHYGELKDLNEDPNYLIVRGIILARRDNCKLLRDIYRNMLNDILYKKDMKSVLSKLIKNCIKLYRGDVNYFDCVVVRSLGSHYKSDSYFMKLFGEQLKAIGKPANPGDRLDYVICEGEGLLGQRMRLVETYIERLQEGKPDKIDYRYYLEKLFIKSLEQLWYVGYKKELDILEKQYDQEDKLEIIKEMYTLIKKDTHREFLVQIWNYYQGNLDSIVEWLDNKNHEEFGINSDVHKYLLNKYTKARQIRVSGRSVFHARVLPNPVKNLLKAIDMNKLDEYAKVVLLPEDYKELFPN